MKIKLITAIVGSAAALALTSAQATPVNPFTGDNIESGQSTLASASTAGDSIVIFWGVDKSGSTYTYQYQVWDTSTHGGANGTGDIVESFNVGFNTSATPGAVLATTAGGVVNASGVTWTFAAVQPGGVSGVLSFTSLLAPTMGNGNALDSNPPSPWASIPGGQQVPVPTVPDGGTTVILLGSALSGLGFISRKLRA